MAGLACPVILSVSAFAHKTFIDINFAIPAVPIAVHSNKICQRLQIYCKYDLLKATNYIVNCLVYYFLYIPVGD